MGLVGATRRGDEMGDETTEPSWTDRVSESGRHAVNAAGHLWDAGVDLAQQYYNEAAAGADDILGDKAGVQMRDERAETYAAGVGVDLHFAKQQFSGATGALVTPGDVQWSGDGTDDGSDAGDGDAY